MDARTPTLDGITATRHLTTQSPHPDRLTKVLVLTTVNDDEVVYAALRAGASGFLLKHAAPKDLITAVRTVAAGDSWLDPAIAGKVIAALTPFPAPGHGSSQLLERLTPHEREVLGLITHGLSTTEIKDQLVLGEAAVKTPRRQDPPQDRLPRPRPSRRPRLPERTRHTPTHPWTPPR